MQNTGKSINIEKSTKVLYLTELNCKFEAMRTKFEPSEYNDLRTFFDQLVAKQNEQIVLKKK